MFDMIRSCNDSFDYWWENSNIAEAKDTAIVTGGACAMVFVVTALLPIVAVVTAPFIGIAAFVFVLSVIYLGFCYFLWLVVKMTLLGCVVVSLLSHILLSPIFFLQWCLAEDPLLKRWRIINSSHQVKVRRN